MVDPMHVLIAGCVVLGLVVVAVGAWLALH
jgi:hypothetical protein